MPNARFASEPGRSGAFARAPRAARRGAQHLRPSRRRPRRSRRSRRSAPARASCATGENQQAVLSLEYAAEQGVIPAQWKLARMYAEGNGVDRVRPQGVRILQPHRGHACRRQSRHAAGARRRQRLRVARPLLPRRHQRHRDQVRLAPRAADVLLCGVVFRRSGRAVSSRPHAARRQSQEPAAGRPLAARRLEQGPVSPRRPCSAACCSRAMSAYAPARARADVARARARQRQRRRRAGSRTSISPPSRRRPRTSARSRATIWCSGSRASATDRFTPRGPASVLLSRPAIRRP